MRRRFINNVNTTFANYMFVESLYNETNISISKCSPTLMYKVDDTNWEIVGDNKFDYTLSHVGEKIFFKDVRYTTPSGVGMFTANVGFKVGGDFRSLFLGDNVKENSPLLDFCFEKMFMNSNIECFDEDILYYPILANHCYYRMFAGCHKITTPPKLPAMILANYCYSGMFENCSNLEVVFKLPATKLAQSCYSYMFYGCTSLTTAPELPATSLANNCYGGMFQNCTSLTSAPALPATSLASYCYSGIFKGCSKLNYIKMLATNISATDCLNSWVNGVASIGTFVKNPNMTSLPTAKDYNYYAGIPSGWTVVNDGEESGVSGKIVNHGVMTISKTLKSFNAKIVFEFPCASTISINVITSLVPAIYGVSEGNAYVQFSGVGEFQSFTFTPTEDDTYIYEIEVKIE